MRSAILFIALLVQAYAFTVPVKQTTATNRVGETQLRMMDPSPISDFLHSSMTIGAAEGLPSDVGYSKVSYYTILGLYILSFPGIWSQIKRSTSAKVKRKTFVSPGENADGGKDLRTQAGEIMAYMKANNYEVVEAGETIKFQGLVQRSVSQASFLVVCTALGMASLALVLQIQFNGLSK